MPLDIIIKFKNSNDEVVKTGDDLMDSFENEYANTKNESQYWFSSKKIRVINKIQNFLTHKEFIGNVSSLSLLLDAGKSLNNNQPLNDFMLSVI